MLKQSFIQPLAIGDKQYIQGDDEVSGTALEMDATVIVTIEIKDIFLATKNALLEMIEYISETYGYTREEAFLIAFVNVDLRIDPLADIPNFSVPAILPLDIFVDK